MHIEIITRLIEKGASIRYKIRINNCNQYPLTIAIETKLDIEYIKMLDNSGIPPSYKFWLIEHFNPTDDIIMFLLQEISKFIEDDRYIQEWLQCQWDAPFLLDGRKRAKIYSY